MDDNKLCNVILTQVTHSLDITPQAIVVAFIVGFLLAIWLEERDKKDKKRLLCDKCKEKVR